jgi:Flp pilus assembly protein TadG
MKRPRGQALVEFSIISVAFLLLFFVILDGGRAIYTYQTVGEAAREGAHAAELTDSTDAQIRSAINAHTGLLGDLGAGATINPTVTRNPNQTVTVTVTYTFRTITPLLSQFGPITFTATTTVIAE